MILGTGAISKMRVEHLAPANYHLPLGEETVHMNALLGSRIKLTFLNRINCQHCGRITKRVSLVVIVTPVLKSLPNVICAL